MANEGMRKGEKKTGSQCENGELTFLRSSSRPQWTHDAMCRGSKFKNWTARLILWRANNKNRNVSVVENNIANTRRHDISRMAWLSARGIISIHDGDDFFLLTRLYFLTSDKYISERSYGLSISMPMYSVININPCVMQQALLSVSLIFLNLYLS